MTAVAWTCTQCRAVGEHPELLCGDPCCPRKPMTTPTKAENPSAELATELQRRIALAKAMDGRVSLSVVEATTLCALLAQRSTTNG